jgi:hypothetical protein
LVADAALVREPEERSRAMGDERMAKHVLLVFSNPTEGAEDEYNRWYNDVHLPEVVQTDGFVSAQRFRLDDGAAGVVEQRYLAVYEVEGDDVELAKKSLDQAAGSYNMSRAIDLKNTKVVWASAVSEVVER